MAKRLREMRPTLDELLLIDLRRDYAVFRKRWFGNSIPPVEEVILGLANRKQMSMASGRECLGFCIPGSSKESEMPVIVINKTGPDCERANTLLHEMAHVKVERKFGRDMWHGTHWQAEMKRLARIGAFKNIW